MEKKKKYSILKSSLSGKKTFRTLIKGSEYSTRLSGITFQAALFPEVFVMTTSRAKYTISSQLTKLLKITWPESCWVYYWFYWEQPFAGGLPFLLSTFGKSRRSQSTFPWFHAHLYLFLRNVFSNSPETRIVLCTSRIHGLECSEHVLKYLSKCHTTKIKISQSCKRHQCFVRMTTRVSQFFIIKLRILRDSYLSLFTESLIPSGKSMSLSSFTWQIFLPNINNLWVCDPVSH